MYSGQAAIVVSAVWVMVRGQTMAGVFLLIGFLLIFQYAEPLGSDTLLMVKPVHCNFRIKWHPGFNDPIYQVH